MKIKKERKRIDSDNIIILIPYWSSHGTKENSFDIIKEKIPNNFGYMYYYFTRDLLNSDPFLTKKNFNRFLSTICGDMDRLDKTKKRKYFFYGQSLGALFAMIISDKRDVEKCILINCGDNLAESFWKGRSTINLKKEMKKKGINMNQLKNIWKTISPDFYFKNKARKTKFFIKLSRWDKIIPYKNGKKLINLLKQKKIKVKTYISFLPHPLSLIFECFFPKRTFKFITKDSI